MRNTYRLILGLGIIAFTLLSLQIANTKQTTVGKPPLTDNILRSKIAFAVVGEAIASSLNLHTLSESDYYKLRGPVLLEQQTDIHFQLREEFDRIVNTVDFRASLNTGSPSQNLPVRQDNTPVLYPKAAEIIRDFIARRDIPVIIGSNAPIGIGEIAAIRRLQGEVRYTYEIINSAAVSVPLKNIAALIKLPFITEIWPDRKGHLSLANSIPHIGADKVHKSPPDGLGVTGAGVKVAVVDTGIAIHYELNVTETRGIDFLNLKSKAHGTRVAGIIGAADNPNDITGVAPGVSLLDAATSIPRGLLATGWDGRGFVYSETLDAIEWAVKNGADVINISQGWDPWAYGRSGTDDMSKLIDSYSDEGAVFVVSAGNGRQRRASGDFNNLPNKASNNPLIRYHQFNSGPATDDTGTETEIRVTLIWENRSSNSNVFNDLDLAILDPGNNNKEIFFARNHGGFGDAAWSGTTNYGTVFEQVEGTVNPNKTYIVRVEGYEGQGWQDYEVWLGGNDLKESTFSIPRSTYTQKTVSVPGYSKNAITVGAIDGSSNTIPGFSGQGPSEHNKVSNTNLIKPEVVAPGVNIESTFPGSEFRVGSGTSLAAPHVAGVAALILDAVGKNDNGEWNFSPDQVKSAIVRGAEVVGNISNTPNNESGAGLVSADNIIFGGDVRPGATRRFKITPGLLGYQFPGVGYLNAENKYPDTLGVDFAVAISWEDPNNDLDLSVVHQNGNQIAHTREEGQNYEKISELSFSHSLGTNDFLFLDVYNPPGSKVIRFTGTSTQPIIGWIPDPNLERAIQQEIGDPIKRAKLRNLKTLSAEDSGIKDLTGLEQACNLTELNLSSNDISYISALSGLTELNVLDLSNNNISGSDISALSGLTELNVLDLSNNNISDSAISVLTKPTHLLQAVSGVLTELNVLDLSGNNISDISALSKLTNLSRLDLADNEISNTSALWRLTKLNELDLSGNNISDSANRIGLLTNLSQLDLSGNNISDISTLSKLTKLKELWLFSNNISDISALSELTQLEELRLFSNSISDISVLSELTGLRVLYLSDNNISDISALSGLTQLRYLQLSQNSISDLSPLVELVELGWLKHLTIRTNPLSYVSVNTHIPAMKDKGVQVFFQNLTHAALMKISGDMQEGEAGTALTAPLVVEALDADGAAMTDIAVTFSVVEGDGHISATTTTTDAKGRAQTTLTLGSNPGPNKVRVTAVGIIARVTFTATTTSPPEVESDLPNEDKNTTKWGLPEGAKARLGKGLISEAAYSPNKKLLAVGTNIGAWLYDAESGEPLSLLTGHKNAVEHVAFSQDNKTLATGGTDKTVRLWDVATGTELAVLQHSGYYGVHDLAFSPDGTTLAVSDGSGVSLWDVTDVGAQATLSRETENPLAKETVVVGPGDVLVFSPDGGTLAVISDYSYPSIYFVDMDTLTVGPRVRSDKSLDSTIAAAFSPGGGTLATVGTDVTLWDVASATVKKHIDGGGYGGPLAISKYVAFSPDGTTLAFDRRNQVYSPRSGRFHGTNEQVHFVHLLDIATGTVKASLKNRPTGIVLQSDAHVALDFNWDGTLHAVGTGTWDEGAEPWIEIENALNVKIDLFSLTGHIGVPGVGMFSPDGNIFAMTNGYETIWLWDVATSTHRHIILEEVTLKDIDNGFRIGHLWLSPDSTTLATGDKLWDVATGTLKSTLHGSVEGRRVPIGTYAFSSDSTHILRGLGLYEVATGTLKTEYSVDNYYNLSRANTWFESSLKSSGTAFSLNGTFIAAISLDRSGTIWLWDVPTDTLIATLPGHPKYLYSWHVEFSPDGTIFVAKNSDGDAVLWDVASGTEIGILPHLHDMSQIEAFSPDSTILVTEDYAARSMNFWDTETATQLYTISTSPSKGVFSPDGTTFATIKNESVVLWDVATGGTLKVIRTPHRERINDLDFSSDDTTLATSSSDGTVLFWEIEPSPPSKTENEISAADVNGDGEINIQDVVLVSSSLGQTGENAADVNGDGEVNIQDLVAVAAAIGEVAAAPAALRQQGATHLTPEEVQHWLTQAQQAGLTDATSVRGIRFLKQLLEAFTPKETALLANYPNPFNPETWIPYQLATAADVKLTIYDIQGHVVRDLDLGHQRPGMYQSKSRAAYWDGRNAVGEPVASGVYFYTLTADDFTATRKLLIRK